MRLAFAYWSLLFEVSRAKYFFTVKFWVRSRMNEGFHGVLIFFNTPRRVHLRVTGRHNFDYLVHVE